MAPLEPDVLRVTPAVDVDLSYQVVIVGVIAHCPDDAAGAGLWSSLSAEFHRPLLFFAILDMNLQLGALPVAFDKSELVGKIWSTLPATLAIKQVEASYV